ncbi:MAG: hypothetical protein ACLQBD_24055 [Syntrophobacteraceae bacterium]
MAIQYIGKLRLSLKIWKQEKTVRVYSRGWYSCEVRRDAKEAPV